MTQTYSHNNATDKPSAEQVCPGGTIGIVAVCAAWLRWPTSL